MLWIQGTGGAVAIKSVDLSKVKGKVKDNLYSEIKILQQLRHPHIVALHECVETPTQIHLMMEFCEFGDLSQFIKRRDHLESHPGLGDVVQKYPNNPNAGLNEVIIRHFAKQLASSLEFLRTRNLIHRDVKPQNLLLLAPADYREKNKHKTGHYTLSASHDSLIPAAGLRSLPMLKLADFGFARVLPKSSLAETLCGSPLYMAPEILRYEKYDHKADLWSVGTVLYEMAAGKPPFRASNHVELLRKIESAKDSIPFPSQSRISSDLKSLIRGLLKRNPVERLSFEQFFAHEVVTGPIPGADEDDQPRLVESRKSKEVKPATKPDDPSSLTRKLSLRRPEQDQTRGESVRSPGERPYRRSPLSTPTEAEKQLGQPSPRLSYSPRQEIGEGLGIRRPQVMPSTSAPTRPAVYEARRRAISNASATKLARDGTPSAGVAEASRNRSGTQSRKTPADEDKAQQEIAFERDYVLVDKNQVAVNALADELAAEGRLALQAQAQPPRSGQIVRRTTTQGAPDSTTGAVPPAPSRTMQIAQGRQRPSAHERRSSLSASPTSYISKAIQDASLRLLGIKYPPGLGKGASPPQLYSPFPAYPTPSAPVGLIGDGKQSAPYDEDARVAKAIEDYASRSDCVYGFAEVKYMQLVPLTPSMEHGLGGVPADRAHDDTEDILATDAIVTLSEEALVLFVKALSLLAKSMDIASMWWQRKAARSDSTGALLSSRDSVNRINSAVQWVRARFNETLEKAEIVRLKLIEAQRSLPEDHPSHPSNHPSELGSPSGSSVDGVVITPGMSAEKLMYDRAVEMSRKAAIDEISNEDLPGCELAYHTALRMLEAVIDKDDDLPKRRASGPPKDSRDEAGSDITSDDQQAVQKCKFVGPPVFVWVVANNRPQ